MPRALFIAVFFFTMTPLLISIQWLLGKLGLPGWGFIACNYYRVLRALLRIHVRVDGEPVRDRAVLFISNHVSWVDIVVIGSIQPVAFVAKSEVRKWPLVGAIKHAADHAAAEILIQPMSICYTGLHGIPMGRQHRPLVAWYGDLDFMPHIKEFIERGAVDAVVSYAEPVAADGAADRKAMAKTLEGAVRAITATTLRGRPKSAHAAE